jgi:Tetratricopeptide repeat
VRASLAASYRQAGRTAEAVTILEKVVTDYEQIIGPRHPDTLAAANALRGWKDQSKRHRWWQRG